jgi:hypothetical protein
VVKGADAFRVIMDKYLGTDLIILTSNEIQKVDGGIKSRSKCLHVPPCEPHVFLPRALDIVHDEGYDIDPNELLATLEAVYDQKPDNRRYYEKIDELLQTVAAKSVDLIDPLNSPPCVGCFHRENTTLWCDLYPSLK